MITSYLNVGAAGTCCSAAAARLDFAAHRHPGRHGLTLITMFETGVDTYGRRMATGLDERRGNRGRNT